MTLPTLLATPDEPRWIVADRADAHHSYLRMDAADVLVRCELAGDIGRAACGGRGAACPFCGAWIDTEHAGCLGRDLSAPATPDPLHPLTDDFSMGRDPRW
jgi:hypothetical protein